MTFRYPAHGGEEGRIFLRNFFAFCKYRIIEREALSGVLGVPEERLAGVHEQWIETVLARDHRWREPKWSEAIAVGRRCFVEEIQRNLGARARYRQIDEEDGVSVLRDAKEVYGPIPRPKWAA